MVTVVVAINLVIALSSLFVAWQLWKLRRILAGVTNGILSADRSTYNVLHPAAGAIMNGEIGIKQARSRYQQLEMQLQQIQQVLVIITLGQKIWQGFYNTQRKLNIDN